MENEFTFLLYQMLPVALFTIINFRNYFDINRLISTGPLKIYQAFSHIISLKEGLFLII